MKKGFSGILEMTNDTIESNQVHVNSTPKDVDKTRRRIMSNINGIPYLYGDQNFPFWDNGNALGTVVDIKSARLVFDDKGIISIKINSRGISFSSGKTINNGYMELHENKAHHILHYKYSNTEKSFKLDLDDEKNNRIATIYRRIKQQLGLPLSTASSNSVNNLQSRKSNDKNNQKTNSFVISILKEHPVAIGLVCLIVLGFFFGGNDTNKSKPKKPPQITSSTNNKANIPIEPIAKQNVVTGYDSSKPILNADGLCELTIDNSRNDMPVYVRVWDMDIHQPVRAFYIEKGDEFTAYDLTPGTYEVRYIELYDNDFPANGAKSEQFELKQIESAYEIQYSQMSLTLYKVRNGNTRTTSIPANQI